MHIIFEVSCSQEPVSVTGIQKSLAINLKPLPACHQGVASLK